MDLVWDNGVVTLRGMLQCGLPLDAEILVRQPCGNETIAWYTGEHSNCYNVVVIDCHAFKHIQMLIHPTPAQCLLFMRLHLQHDHRDKHWIGVIIYTHVLYMYVYIYMYMYICICMYVCIYIWLYNVSMCVHMYVRMYDLLFTSPFIHGLSNQTRKLSVAASIYVANQTIFSRLTIHISHFRILSAYSWTPY